MNLVYFITTKYENRKFPVGYTTAYRFGFNGKEIDPEGMGGGGNTYDYGFRIYNPRLGKFLSVDPLTKSYPWYTPYQFAGNMPIWAIDLDGLEEYIYVYAFQGDNNPALLVEQKHNVEYRQVKDPNTGETNIVPYNIKTGEPFDESQWGTVQYKYESISGVDMNLRKNIDGSYSGGEGDIMPLHQDNRAGNIYPGSNNPQVEIDGVMVDDYRREPLNEVDLAGYNHDKNYDKVGARGKKGAFFDKKALAADEQIVKDCDKVVEKYKNGECDLITGKKIPEEMANEASQISKGFTLLQGFKKIFGSNKVKYDEKK